VSTAGIMGLVALPCGVGLLGFVEPCTMGSTLVFIKHIEGLDRAEKLIEVGLFAITRALFIGALGVTAAMLGTAFLGFQRGAWIALGALYVVIGTVYVIGCAGALLMAAGATPFGPAVLLGPAP